MVRISVLILLVAIAVTGCKKRAAQPEASDAEQRQAIQDYARSKIPVLDRTIVQQEMQQILLFLQSTSGWPKDIAAAREEMKRDADMRKLSQKVDEGLYVISNKAPQGGILIHCTKETTVGFIAMTPSGEFKQMKQSELDAELAKQSR